MEKRYPDFVRAAHFFSDGWALNSFQIFESNRVDDGLEQIRKDGFNTIILVFPWHGVQDLQGQLDEFYFSQLTMVLKKARQKKLNVILRLSYGFHSVPHKNITGFTRLLQLLCDAEVQECWQSYLARIQQICRRTPGVIACFLSWEEFWNPLSALCGRGESYRREFATRLGFPKWLEEESLPPLAVIPRKDEVEYKHYHAFKNHCIARMHDVARAAFPDLGIEFRVDRDPCFEASEVNWLACDDFRDADVPRFSYWAPFMGAGNHGEKISSERALELLEHTLRQVSVGGGRSAQIVDQFNFVDDTPDTDGRLAVIDEEAVPDFLAGAGDLLRRYSGGYGIWAPSNYRQNILYNARFMRGLDGWHYIGGQPLCAIGRSGCYLPEGLVLSQHLAAPLVALQRSEPLEELRLRLDFAGMISGRLRVVLNRGEPHDFVFHDVDYVETTLSVLHGDIWENGVSLEIHNLSSGLKLDSVQLYHRIYRGGVREVDGQPGPWLEPLRRLNESFE